MGMANTLTLEPHNYTVCLETYALLIMELWRFLIGHLMTRGMFHVEGTIWVVHVRSLTTRLWSEYRIRILSKIQ